MKNRYNYEWKNWVETLLSGMAAWAGIQALTFFLLKAPFYSCVMDSIYGSWLWLLPESAVFLFAPYWAVIVGAKVAKGNKSKSASILAILVLLIQLTLTLNHQITSLTTSVSIFVGIIGTFIALCVACFQVHVGKTPI